jgi:iron complex outermembrane receptor protein
VDVAAFDNFYTGLPGQKFVDFIGIAAPTPHAAFQTELANLQTGQTYGAEMAADWNVNNNWKLSTGFTWLEMSLQSGVFQPQYSAGTSPNYEGNLRSYWNFNKDWSFDTAAYYVDKLPAFNTPAYVRLDTNIGWKIEPGIQLNVVGQNLLQSKHMEFGGTTDLNASEIPRSYYAKITCKF